MEMDWATIDELAGQAGDAMRDGRADDARKLLGQVFEQRAFLWAARRVHAARGIPPRIAVEDLEQDLWLRAVKKIDQFKPDAHFSGWLRKMCERLLLSALRKRANSEMNRSVELHAESSPDSGQRSAVEQVLAEEFDQEMRRPFSDRDWNQIVLWACQNPRTPVTVLVGFGFWRKLRSDTSPDRLAVWNEWLEDCGIENPAAMLSAMDHTCNPDDINGRIRILAEHLDLSYNSTWKDWDRKRHLVVELEFFWQHFLSSFGKFQTDQVRAVGSCLLNDRIPILCIDQIWPRAQGLDQWLEFRADYRFRGTPPLLRFLQLVQLEDRIELFAKSMYGEVAHNVTMLTRLLINRVSFRKTLRA